MSSLPSSPPPPAFVKEIILGPVLGTFGMLLLYGMTAMQAYLYYTHFSSDHYRIKALVAVIILLETLNLFLECHYVYYYLIEHFGQAEVILEIVWSVWLSDQVGFIVAWLVNMFFVRRIYILSGRKLWLAMIIGALATIRPAFGFTAASYATVYTNWVVFHQHVQWMFITGLSIGLSVDFAIAFFISFYLLRERANAIRSTRNIVNLLLWYTINTTAILSFFAVIEMVLLLTQPNSLLFLGLFQIQIQLYANCFMTSLNAREALRKEPQDITPMVTMATTTAGRTTIPHMTSTGGVTVKTSLVSDSEQEQGYPDQKIVPV